MRWRRRILCLLSLLLAAELVSRVYWLLRGPVGFLRPVLQRGFYPELAAVQDWPIRRENPSLDVLLLGASVLHPNWGFVREFLYEELQAHTRRTVYVHNLAQGGHTMADSRRKYEAITDQTFDLVVVYHGINDTRANNCPPERFAPDYSHMLWYDQLCHLDRHPETPVVTLPFTAGYAWRTALAVTGLASYLPATRPDPRWLDHGGTLRSVASFTANLEAIVARAHTRGDRVLLMTFAWYLPADYSEARFWRHEPDYTGNGSAVELWGRPDHVVAGIVAHNAAVRTVAAATGAALVDQERLMPKDGGCFHDICHFTGRGSQRFVANMLDVVRSAAGDSR